MKLKYDFETTKLDDSYVSVPVGENSQDAHLVLKLNETALDVMQLLKDETTEDAIIESILQKYEGDKDEICSTVHDLLELLVKENLVEQ